MSLDAHMTAPEDESEDIRTVTTVQMKAGHAYDGYELETPLPLPQLSTPEAMFSIVAADPENGLVTVERDGTDEYWQFPVDQISSHTKVEYDFVLPKREPVVAPAVQRMKHMVSKVVAATATALASMYPNANHAQKGPVSTIQAPEPLPSEIKP